MTTPPKAVGALGEMRRYAPNKHPAPIELRLSGNEGALRDPQIAARLASAISASSLRDYPDTTSLTAQVAERFGVTTDRVLVTAGADDALYRALLCYASGRNVVLPSPTFEMLDRYIALVGGELRTIPWTQPSYPLQEVESQIDPNTGVVFVVSPNNPTGGCCSPAQLKRLLRSANNALVIVDEAYGEFANEPLTEIALSSPNALLLRTLSKAWGLAGLRVGFAIGAPEVIEVLRSVGQPYAVSGPSLAIAVAALAAEGHWVDDYVDRVRTEREQLVQLLAELGQTPQPSQGNFVWCQCSDPHWITDALAGQGIAIRRFAAPLALQPTVRITCPGIDHDFERLSRALRQALRPEALLFDMDGVLIDTSQSYRAAIIATAAAFGVQLSASDVSAAKAAGDANDDWLLTQRLIGAKGVEVSLERVTECFEGLYQGTANNAGLFEKESLLPNRQWLEQLGRRFALGIVTGRPRRDALRALELFDIAELFSCLVTRDEAPLKPSPAGLELACQQLQVSTAWYIGDTPDDVHATRRAGLLPLGILAPGERPANASVLLQAGAARVLTDLAQLGDLL
ncbi:MAG: aminotransferase class I/II-fold pyridoxal phosphate-dependent enzyme [Deltaproteobacteria bacterium]|nr:aminotransferase class I/II-fold pyridoxal phosphate-dependent enzyme [Deltaproteobacteria bacterium]